MSGLGETYIGAGGDEIVAAKVIVRVSREELVGILADKAVTSLLLDDRLPWAPSSAPIRRVREAITEQAHNWGGSLPWDQWSGSSEREQDRAEKWARKVVERAWPS